jgi:hypothetical protein
MVVTIVTIATVLAMNDSTKVSSRHWRCNQCKLGNMQFITESSAQTVDAIYFHDIKISQCYYKFTVSTHTN